MGSLMYFYLAILLLPLCSAGNLYYVTPNNNTSCPGEPCHTLEYYIQDPSRYFTSDTTIELLPGMHVLEGFNPMGDVSLGSQVMNLTIRGSGMTTSDGKPATTILCQNQIGFAFRNITKLTFANLALVKCSSVNTTSALYFGYVIDLQISNVFVTNSPGYGLLGYNILGNSSITDSAFVKNVGEKSSGGNMLLYFSLHQDECSTLGTDMSNFSVQSSLFSEGHGLQQLSPGLSIRVDNACMDTNIQIVDAVFERNGDPSNGYGGNILMTISEHVQTQSYITIQNTVVEGGAAVWGGGMLLVVLNTKMCASNASSNSQISIINTYFQSNIATDGGGLLVHFEPSCQQYHLLLHNVIFDNNSAEQYGGGICIRVSDISQCPPVETTNQISITDTSILANSAGGKGGGMWVGFYSKCQRSYLTLFGTNMDNNTATDGGNLFIHTDPFARPNVTIENTVIKSGSAVRYGGGICIHFPNISQCSPVETTNQISITDTSILANSAGDKGGGMWVALYSTCQRSYLTLYGTNLDNNTATDGGNLYIFFGPFSRPNVTIENTVIKSGSAVRYGGGISIHAPNVSQCSPAEAINEIRIRNTSTLANSAGDAGGGMFVALYSTCQSLSLHGTHFNNNTATDGGNLYIYTDPFGHTDISIKNAVIQYGSATGSGGGIGVLVGVVDTLLCSMGDDEVNHIRIENTNITSNHASRFGGGLSAAFQSSCCRNYLYLNNVHFDRNSAEQGGGNLIIIMHTDISMDPVISIAITNTVIENGLAIFGGGLLLSGLTDSTTQCVSTEEPKQISIVNTSIHHNNAHLDGGGLLITAAQGCRSHYIVMHNVCSDANTAARFGGNVGIILSSTNKHAKENTIAIYIRNCSIRNGKSKNGGGLYLGVYAIQWERDVNFHYSITNTDISNNVATARGGGLTLSGAYSSTFTVKWKAEVTNCTFKNNSSPVGSAIAAKVFFETLASTVLQLVLQNISGINNYATHFSPPHSDQVLNGAAAMVIESVHNVTIIDCQFLSNYGGAIAAVESTLLFKGTSLLQNNTSNNGGGIQLCSGSTLLLSENTSVHLIDNHAMHAGGAIYVEQQGCALQSDLCFYRPYTFVKQNWSDTSIQIFIENNTATYAGSAIYGGRVDDCTNFFVNGQLKEIGQDRSQDFFDALFIIDQTGDSVISSDPVGVCLCKQDHLDCKTESSEVHVFPGQMFTVEAVVVGQRNGTVPGIVRALFQMDRLLDEFQDSQITNGTCTTLSYTVFSIQLNETLTLVPENSNPDMLWETLGVSTSFVAPILFIKLLSCPVGFSLTLGPKPKCDCTEELQKLNVICDINQTSIRRPPGIWIGYQDNSQSILVHKHCPFDYCIYKHINIRPNSSNDQCALNHSGILCGGCRSGLSLSLGTSQCMECYNTYLTLVLAFAIAGIGLVAFLTLFDLTVSEGTLNALIFYANILQINKTIFFPSNSGNVILTSILTVFLAWLNLDLGIETCFYNGMDMYAKAWLQFVFPIYIWLIVIAMIVSSHYSTVAAKVVSRKNAPKVLATLFLLSYAKLLRATITVFSITFLEYPDGRHILWLYDGNVPYLSGKHVPLFLAALLFLLVFSFPYTIALVFIQCLQRRSGYIVLTWVRRLKPLLDAYTGPYKDKYRFWTGLLLLVRVFLFLGFALNVLGDPDLNLLLILMTSLFLLLLMWAFQRIYRKWPLDVLEMSFLMNLSTFSGATLYVRPSSGHQVAISYTSVSIAFATFIGIFIYCVLIQIKASHCWKCFNSLYKHHPSSQELDNLGNEGDPSDSDEPSIQPQARVQPLQLIFNENNELVFVVDDEIPDRVQRETLDDDEECILVVENA